MEDDELKKILKLFLTAQLAGQRKFQDKGLLLLALKRMKLTQ